MKEKYFLSLIEKNFEYWKVVNEELCVYNNKDVVIGYFRLSDMGDTNSPTQIRLSYANIWEDIELKFKWNMDSYRELGTEVLHKYNLHDYNANIAYI